jgi:hypothetical protein
MGYPRMDDMLGYCGYDCGICPARSPDPAVRLKMVEGWTKFMGHTAYAKENVPAARPCCGCKGEGELADKNCQARPCAIEKGVSSCTECDEFPCKKVRHLIGDRDTGLLFFFRHPDATRQDYEMCMRQFESAPNLIRLLLEQAKMPDWVHDYYHRDPPE